GLAQSGRTCLFVSHNMHHVGSLSKRCLYLGAGSVIYDGGAGPAIDLYFRDVLRAGDSGGTGERAGSSASGVPVAHQVEAIDESGSAALLSVEAAGPAGRPELRTGDDLQITVTYSLPESSGIVHVQISLWTEQGLLVTTADSRAATTPGFPAGERRATTC